MRGKPGRAVWRGVAVICAIVAIVAALVAAPARSEAKGTEQHPIKTIATGINLSSKVVTLSRAFAKQELIGVSANGAFKFKRAAGPLAALRKGKVMLISGVDAVEVIGISHRHGNLLVATAPAKLTDLVTSGKLTFSGTPNFQTGTLIGSDLTSVKHSASEFVMPAWLGRKSGRVHAAAGSPSISAQGSFGGVGYSLTFTPATSTHLDISGTLCFATGSICGNGPSNGLDAEVYLSGYLDTSSTSGSVEVSNGRVSGSNFSVGGVTASLKMSYHITNHDGTESNPPVITLPIGYGMSLPTASGIPLYIRLQFVLAMSFGLTKGATENGGVVWNSTGGLEALRQVGANIATSSNSVSGDTSVLDQSNGGVPISFAPTASGSAITLRLKYGAGVGLSAASAIWYIDWIEGLGQEIGSAVVGQFCSSYYSQFTVGTGVEAQIGLGGLGLAIASPRVELLKKVSQVEDPGCPPITGAADVFAPRLAWAPHGGAPSG